MSNVDLKPEDEALVELVRRDFKRAEKRHEPFRKNCERRYRMYRSYHESRRHLARFPRDRDDVMGSMKRTWGAELFIPYTFSVIETILPRMLSASPRMNVEPGNPMSEVNVDNMKVLLDRQQDQIDYQIVLQNVAKPGLMYGLGVQKSYWKTEYKQIPVLERPTVPVAGGDEWIVSKPTKRKTFDDPFAEAVDVWDFLWDPFASDIADAEFVIHRTWRSERYVRRMIESGAWRQDWPLEDMLSGSPTTKRSEIWSGRDAAGGFSAAEPDNGKVHEVWEYHDGTRVITVLDSTYPVISGVNPFWHGELPFQIYRPTIVNNEFVGIGEIEPIEHLQEEMNTLRSQRRDNATLKLQQVFAYFDGMVDPDHLKFGPGIAIPVNGDPHDLLLPINVGDIPNSGYQEEKNLQDDIARTTGLDDSQAGVDQSGTAQTATGAQLVQAAANVRIRQKTTLLEVQVAKPTARQWVAMNQQKIRTTRFIAGPPSPEEPEARWKWYKLGPPEMEGEFNLEPDGGASQPDNIPQMRQDAQELMLAFSQNPMVNQPKLIELVLKKYGVSNPQSYLQAPPPEPQEEEQAPEVPPETLDLIAQGLESAGMDEQQAQHLIAGALAHAKEMEAAEQAQGAQGSQNGSQGPPQQGPPAQGPPQPPQQAQTQPGQQQMPSPVPA